ncbi:uncharacterized protein LOC106013152 [Aplysia californica]|uniref:Uncharacterized protein LOC106013152 n=1 Tax=Aplysia californica TaxID=6500 RepID=A0ABM1A9U3_APLCA|nr:uncharacterized protein LOC106013152 [Aplysia californica]
MWRRSLQDVKVRRGADVGSDHHLVTARIKLKLKKTFSREATKTRLNVHKLSDGNVRSAFRLELKNRFQTLQDQEETTPNTDEVNTQWKHHIVEAYTESSKTCLGVKKKNASKEWIQQGTWNTIEDRREIKKRQLAAKSIRLQEKYAEDYKEACQKVKRLVRKDKREAMEKLATEAEEAAAKGEQGNVYKITRIICGKFHGGMSGPIKDKADKLLTIEKEQEARWTEHFREVLNKPQSEDTPDIQEATLDLDISSDPPQKHEIIKAVKSLKSRKSPGMDNRNAELFKVDPELTATILQPLFKTIWEGEQIPGDRCTGVIFKVPKKGALRDCNNWRGITLLSVPSKTLAKIIINHMSDAVDSCLRKEQNASKEWIQQGTWNTIEERREIKKRQLAAKSIRLQEKYAEDYKEACQKVKRLVRKDKREATEKLATEAEEAAAKGEQGNVYKITRIICGKHHSGMSGKLLIIEKEQEARWTEHFRAVLNQPPPEDTPDIQEATLDLDISSDPPQKHEIVN